MDTFIDKLSNRYSAGEMIKANSEADAAQMDNLQEQVEAYEAVLQEMRKLNYKNTELTEKMYSLVDESIEKVRTLQIEASENGANTELISKEMSEAVTSALNEAMNNMDSTVARTVSESLISALAQPTEEIKQVASKLDDISIQMNNSGETQAQIDPALFDGIAEKVDAVLASVNETAQMIKDDNAQTYELIDSLKNNGVDITPVTAALNANDEKIQAIMQAVAALEDKLTAMGEATPTENNNDDIVAAVQLGNEQNSAVLADIDNRLSAIQSAQTEGQQNAEVLADIDNRLSAIQSSQADGQQNAEVLDAVKTTAESTKIAIEALEANTTGTKQTTEALQADVQRNADILASIMEKLGAIEAKEDARDEAAAIAREEAARAAEEAKLASEADDQKDYVLEAVQTGSLQTREAIASLQDKLADIDALKAANEENKSYITNIWNSVEATRGSVTAMAENSNKADSSLNDDIKSAIFDILTGTEEIRTAVRNLKTANDDTKATLKTALDSAIYGLKQDNKEIVEFMQRMNANILAKPVDPDAERKAEEARLKDEADKAALEERFKLAEDFMHKESVKVYRNVQAVINEKTDRQTDGLDGKVKDNAAKIAQVKVIAIVAAALSGLGLVYQVLNILGIF